MAPSTIAMAAIAEKARSERSLVDANRDSPTTLHGGQRLNQLDARAPQLLTTNSLRHRIESIELIGNLKPRCLRRGEYVYARSLGRRIIEDAKANDVSSELDLP